MLAGREYRRGFIRIVYEKEQMLCQIEYCAGTGAADRLDGRADGRGTRWNLACYNGNPRSSLNSTHPNDGLLSFLSGEENVLILHSDHIADDLCLGSQLGAATSIVSTLDF